MNDNSSIKIARLITLEKKFRNAESETELGFICANELRSIVDYNFLFLLNRSSINRLKVNTISDLSVIDRTAPTVTFIEGLLNKKGMINSDEVSAISLQSLDLDKVNIRGGALSRGHPIGASGAILTVRLFHELIKVPGITGMAAIAAAGGLGSAMMLQS
mgnify:CR=1 FL=1